MAKKAHFITKRLARVLCLIFAATLCPQLAQSANTAEEVHSSGTHNAEQLHYFSGGRNISQSQYQAILLANQADKLLQAGNYKAAIEKFQNSLALDPDQYQTLTSYGHVLARLGRTDEGIVQLKAALQLAPDKPEPMATIASVYQSAGKLKEAIDGYGRFLAKFPQHPIAANVRSIHQQLIEEYKKEQVVAGAADPNNQTDDYFGFATYEAVTKWPKDRFPLKVFVPSDAETVGVPHYEPRFGSALKQAFESWAARSKGSISFDFVPVRTTADIECLWTADPSKVSRPAEGGESHVQYDSKNGIEHAEIILLTKMAGHTNNPVPVNIIEFACLHEIGHSLGLVGHSPDARDIMFCSLPTADCKWALTDRDAKTVLHLYSPNVQIAFHNRAPVSTVSDKISLNNEGVNLAMQQKFVQARQKFEASLKADPSYEPAQRNLASCLNNLAIDAAKSQQYNVAADLFKRIVELQKGEPDRSKRLAILRNYSYVLQRLNRPVELSSVNQAIIKLTGDTAVTTMESK